MSRKKKAAPTFRERITKRLRKTGNKKGQLKELHRERASVEKKLKKLRAEIAREEKRLKKLKRRIATAKLKKARQRAATHQRELKTLSNIRQIVTKAKRRRGRKTERKSKIETAPRKLRSGKKYGEKKTYTFTKFNHDANYKAIDTWLGVLKKHDLKTDTTTYMSAQIEGKIKNGAEAPPMGGTDPILLAAIKSGDTKKIKEAKERAARVASNKFMWFNLLEIAGYSGHNVDVNTIEKSIKEMVAAANWKTWADSGLPQIRHIVVSTTEAINE